MSGVQHMLHTVCCLQAFATRLRSLHSQSREARIVNTVLSQRVSNVERQLLLETGGSK
jgi:hypothetical protein